MLNSVTTMDTIEPPLGNPGDPENLLLGYVQTQEVKQCIDQDSKMNNAKGMEDKTKDQDEEDQGNNDNNESDNDGDNDNIDDNITNKEAYNKVTKMKDLESLFTELEEFPPEQMEKIYT